ncbi:MAG: hypothetical protein EOP83_25855, partial [Verrucomicrobiaceae bacterium]
MPSINGGRVKSGNGDVYFEGDDTAASSKASTTGQTNSAVKTGGYNVEGVNVGEGIALYSDTKSDGGSLQLRFKSLLGGPGISYAVSNDTITIGLEPAKLRMSFLNLFEAPRNIDSLGIMFATRDQTLAFTPAPVNQGQVLTFDGIRFVWTQPTVGTVTSLGVTGDNAIAVTGNTVTSSGSFGLSLTNTGVTAGSYQAATITVDAQGRITSAAATPVGEVNTVSTLGNGVSLYAGKLLTDLQFKSFQSNGLVEITSTDDSLTLGVHAVTSVGVTAGPGVDVIGNTITTSGSFSVGLSQTGVSEGTYNVVTVDTYGRITNATTQAVGETNTAASLGEGESIVASKTGSTLNFKSLAATGATTVTATTDTVLIETNAVTSVGLVQGEGIAITGNTITDAGEFTVALAP